jgi:YfiR/HmsC-like
LGRSAALWLALLATACLAGTLVAGPVEAQSSEPTEYQVKAAFLFNFTKFIDWPDAAFADAHAPIVLGIVGDDPFGSDLEQIVAGQLVKGRAISIRKYRLGEDLRHCQILFVGDSEQAHIPNILLSVQGASVLTVSDVDQFANAGGTVQFVVEQSRVHFIVNWDAAARVHLEISAKLLALARVINRTESRGVN